jgi:hypothetical protein
MVRYPGGMMRRSVPVMAILLLAVVGCEQEAGKKAPATSGPPAAKRLTTDQARQVVKDVNKRLDVQDRDAAYWREGAEGPWLDQLLATAENAKKYGTSAPPRPANSPKTVPTVHAWSAAGADKWILGAYQSVGFTVGEEKNSTELSWSLYHQGQDGTWRKTFLVQAPSTTSLPRIAKDSDGQAQTAGDTSQLAMPPKAACGRFGDYIAGKSDAETQRTAWSKEIDTLRTSLLSGEKERRKRLGNPALVDLSFDPGRTPHGPVWRTTDGGAVVACVAESKTVVDMGPGRYVEFSYSGWAGTTGIRWSSYTQTLLRMTVLKIPADSGEVSIAAEANWPYRFNGTRYTGN